MNEIAQFTALRTWLLDISRTELRAGTNTATADEILYAGRTMRVIHVWDRIEGGFCKAALRTVQV